MHIKKQYLLIHIIQFPLIRPSSKQSFDHLLMAFVGCPDKRAVAFLCSCKCVFVWCACGCACVSVCIYVCMCKYVCVYVCICLRICMRACVYTLTCIYMYFVHAWLNGSKNSRICICIVHRYIYKYLTSTYIHTHIPAYIHTCIHTYLHTYIYTHTYIQIHRKLLIDKHAYIIDGIYICMCIDE